MDSWVPLLLVLGGFHHHPTEGLEVTCSPYPILTHVGSGVVLECQVLPIMNLQDKEIRWMKGKALVHLYRFSQDENSQQDPSFQGRTQLFKDEFPKGNVSLLLQNVELSDRGTYNCFVEVSPDTNHDSNVELSVTSVGELPSINLLRYTSSGIQLVCDSQQWFPAPMVRWRDQSGKVLAEETQTTTEQNSKDFYHVRSIIEVTEGSGNNYICLIESKVMNQTLSAEFDVPDEFFPRTSKWLSGFLLIFFLLIVVVVLLVLFFRRLQKHIKDLKKRPTAKEYMDLQMKKNALKEELGTLHGNLERIRVLPKTAINRITSVAASVTLDSDTAHPDLKISPDLTTVSHAKGLNIPAGNSKRFDSMLSVMGKEGFSCGRHYWVVQVRSNSEWDLGVALDKVVRQGITPLSPDNGFWTIGCHEKDYRVNATTSAQISIQPLTQAQIQMIGIYVNYSERKVLFCNAETYSHLHTFEMCNFEGVIFPFFNLSKQGEPLKICRVAPSA
ncbi:butyrophilin subfamily 1 member A1-like [Pristis pectinata]|uniref:butyrophilin subfamily 1 member A1-like n=1 Tax=Pristis pectinata TaxID=685728 RepID=UPI00223D2E3D|nr:butyrophilin subfamily 1 member A1-like [Pristis pectinata]